MRLSDYLGCQVVDAAGRPLGRVLDARLVPDGPPRGAFGRSLRLHDLIIGRGSLGARLGLDRDRVHGPWLLKILFARRRLHRIPWEVIDRVEVEHRTIRLTVTGEELRGGTLPTS
ncbi:MAG: hypothetical protein ACXVJ7_09135 [Acidimicrobiia bacterium]